MFINPKPSVAVVILNWNGVNFLDQFLPSVIKSTYPNLDIYLADNNSSDNSISFTQNHYPNIKIIKIKHNFGYAKGYNVALQNVNSDYLVLLNSDVAVTNTWIEPIIEMMEEDKLIAACQPKILSFNNPTHFEYAGAAGGYIDNFGYAFCKGRFFDVCEKDENQYNKNEEVFWASGAALFIRTQLFKDFEGFDASFFAHFEEIDLCWRLKKAGFKIMYNAQSVVYHIGGGTLQQDSPQKTFLNFRNNLITLFKNLYTWELFIILPIRFILDGLAALKAYKNKKTRKNALFILKAQVVFLKNLDKHIANRKKTKQIVKKNNNGKAPNLKGRYIKSIIFDYFIRGKRKFTDLTNFL